MATAHPPRQEPRHNPSSPAPAHAARRRRGLTPEAAATAIEQACRDLRLPTVRTRFPDMLTVAEREQLTYEGFLAELLLAECDDRARRRSIRRVKAAGLPRTKWLADFDFDANPATIDTLAGCHWVRIGQPLCLIGDSGTDSYRLAHTKSPDDIVTGSHTIAS